MYYAVPCKIRLWHLSSFINQTFTLCLAYSFMATLKDTIKLYQYGFHKFSYSIFFKDMKGRPTFFWIFVTSNKFNKSEFAIFHVVRHGNVSGTRIQKGFIAGLVTVEGFWMEFTLPRRTTWQIANSLLFSCLCLSLSSYIIMLQRNVSNIQRLATKSILTKSIARIRGLNV